MISRLLTFFSRFRFLRSALPAECLDNIIYRREIGMDIFGRLRAGSPILSTHLFMFGVLGLIGAAYLLAAWPGVLLITGGELACFALSSYPAAYRHAYFSTRRERASGMLEQIWLSRLTDEEIFEGKFQGLLAPFREIRRYLPVIVLAFSLSVWMTTYGPLWIASITLGLLVGAQFGLSAHAGIVGGMRAGLRADRLGYSMLSDWQSNPWLVHSLAIAPGLAIVAIPLAILYILAYLSRSLVPLYPGALLTALLPVASHGALRRFQIEQHARAAHGFRSDLRSETLPRGPI